LSSLVAKFSETFQWLTHLLKFFEKLPPPEVTEMGGLPPQA
jgi:hypothetical protein